MDALNYFFNVSRFDWIIIPIILCSFLLASGVIIFASLTLKYMFSSSPLIPHPYYATAFKVTFIAFFLFAISKSFVIKEDDVITSTYYQDFRAHKEMRLVRPLLNHHHFLIVAKCD